MASHDKPRFRLFPLSLPVMYGTLIVGGFLSAIVVGCPPSQTTRVQVISTKHSLVELTQAIEQFFDDYGRKSLAWSSGKDGKHDLTNPDAK